MYEWAKAIQPFCVYYKWVKQLFMVKTSEKYAKFWLNLSELIYSECMYPPPPKKLMDN